MHRARDEDSLDGGHGIAPKVRPDSAASRGRARRALRPGRRRSQHRQIAERLDRSPTTVRRWLGRCGLKTAGVRGRRPVKELEHDGPGDARLSCPRHGLTSHRWFSDRGYRCLRCRSMYVADRRRHIKLSLVEEAGGRCIFVRLRPVPASAQLSPRRPDGQVVRHRATRLCACSGPRAGGSSQVRAPLFELPRRG